MSPQEASREKVRKHLARHGAWPGNGAGSRAGGAGASAGGAPGDEGPVHEGPVDWSGARFGRMNTEALMRAELPPLRFVVPGFLPVGVTLLAGPRRSGKSWLALDLAIAVGGGGVAMGNLACERGDALYIDLENGPGRTQRRIATLYPASRVRPNLARLEWAHEAPAFHHGFLQALDEWRRSVVKPRLVVIDGLSRIRIGEGYRSHAMVLCALQYWASLHGIAVLALQETAGGRVAGGNAGNGKGRGQTLEALSAECDATLLIGRAGAGFTLSVRGAEMEESDSVLLFSAGSFTLAGEASAFCRSAERTAILSALREATRSGHFFGGLSPADIAAATGMKGANVRRLIYSMRRDGEVRCGSHGYVAVRDDPSV